MTKPIAYMTAEAMYRLKTYGGNGRGAVPVHAKPSNVSKIKLYTHPVQPISDEAITIMAETYADLGGDISADKWHEFARAIEKAHGIGLHYD